MLANIEDLTPNEAFRPRSATSRWRST